MRTSKFIEQNYCALVTGSFVVEKERLAVWMCLNVLKSGLVTLKKCDHQWFVRFECYAKFARHSSYSHFFFKCIHTLRIIIRMKAVPQLPLCVSIDSCYDFNRHHHKNSLHRFFFIYTYLVSMQLAFSVVYSFVTEKWQRWLIGQPGRSYHQSFWPHFIFNRLSIYILLLFLYSFFFFLLRFCFIWCLCMHANDHNSEK